MEAVPDWRLFGYALLAGILAFGCWVVIPSLDGGWTLPVAIAVFSAILFADGLVAGRRGSD